MNSIAMTRMMKCLEENESQENNKIPFLVLPTKSLGYKNLQDALDFAKEPKKLRTFPKISLHIRRAHLDTAPLTPSRSSLALPLSFCSEHPIPSIL